MRKLCILALLEKVIKLLGLRLLSYCRIGIQEQNTNIHCLLNTTLRHNYALLVKNNNSSDSTFASTAKVKHMWVVKVKFKLCHTDYSDGNTLRLLKLLFFTYKCAGILLTSAYLTQWMLATPTLIAT